VFLACHSQNINIRLLESNNVTVAFDETTTVAHVNQLVQIFAAVKDKKIQFDASKVLLNSLFSLFVLSLT